MSVIQMLLVQDKKVNSNLLCMSQTGIIQLSETNILCRALITVKEKSQHCIKKLFSNQLPRYKS